MIMKFHNMLFLPIIVCTLNRFYSWVIMKIIRKFNVNPFQEFFYVKNTEDENISVPCFGLYYDCIYITIVFTYYIVFYISIVFYTISIRQFLWTRTTDKFFTLSSWAKKKQTKPIHICTIQMTHIYIKK